MFLGIHEATIEANIKLQIFTEYFANFKVKANKTTETLNTIATTILRHDITRETATTILLTVDALPSTKRLVQIIGAIKFLAMSKLFL